MLAAPGAYSEMLGVYFGDGEQHFDFRSLQDHAAPHGTSDLLSKGALRDRSRQHDATVIRLPHVIGYGQCPLYG